MKVLIIKNVFSEGPGTISDYLDAEKIPASVCELGAGGALPGSDSFTHLLIMGGPMAVYEMDRYPYLKKETKLIDRAVKANKHILGVCLGAQMIAHALGARVYAGDHKEIGWQEIALTPEGMKDPVMGTLALEGRSAAEVFQWHGDTFDLPAGAVRLASSNLYPNQAFRFSDRVYALQFHIEVTPEIVSGWLKDEKGIDLKSVDAESKRVYAPYRERAVNFYREFFQL